MGPEYSKGRRGMADLRVISVGGGRIQDSSAPASVRPQHHFRLHNREFFTKPLLCALKKSETKAPAASWRLNHEKRTLSVEIRITILS